MNQCGLCERDLEAGYLCPGDTLALGERLERMPKLYGALAGFLSPAVRATTEFVSRSHATASLPVDEAVLDLRYGGIALVLEGWRSDVQRVRGWGEPAITGDVEERVRRAARWLGMELPWIAAAYPAAGDLACEVRELEGAALSIVGALPDRGRRIGQCVAVDSSGVICGAVIRHQPGQTRLVCDWCHCVYATEQDWLLLLHHQPAESA
ncbi:hypothetical protein NFX46_02020 [Streptomyces phaeoluteigriseus]|uniref:Uncharacterized protein n=1 Tax=Streptomyces phaeoluteigriseus TaxID=114686 RepID=A0ABY4Z1D1_9ACTN|nr:hypothetical protein [Streptomyces phaeoluteigriseus]USQ82652.1 hypothetical protein NFX46_02020 [Streptomyces phaeoluteigriseus]